MVTTLHWKPVPTASKAARLVALACLLPSLGVTQMGAADSSTPAAGAILGEPVNLYAPDSQTASPATPGSASTPGAIYAWPAHGQVWVLAGEPGASNVVAQLGDEGVVVVDTGAQAVATQLLEQIEKLAQAHAGDQRAIHLIVNTNGRADHIGGNQVIREGGNQVIAGEMQRQADFVPQGAEVLANQNVLSRLVAESATSGPGARELWPTDAEDFDTYGLHFNGEVLQLFHPHNANTDGQLMVLFRQSDVIAAGDVMDATHYPVIDVARGGSIDGELVALNELIDMAVPDRQAEGGTVIVPGHGRLCDQSDVVFYKNMITTIRNRVQFYKNQGKTLAQVLALAPTAGWDGRWGASSGDWTTRDFITAVYDTLPARAPAIFSMRDGKLVPSTGAVANGRLY